MLDWGDNIKKIDCSNHLMRNCTVFMENWRKDLDADCKSYFSKNWIDHLASLLHKLINEKSEN